MLPADTAEALNRINRNIERTRASIDFQIVGTGENVEHVVDAELAAVHDNTDLLREGLHHVHAQLVTLNADEADFRQLFE